MAQKSHHIHHVGCGLRVGEISSLEKDSINFNDRTILIKGEYAKGKSDRLVQFSLATKKCCLPITKKDETPMMMIPIYFVNEVGKRVNPRSYRQMIELHAKSQGIKRAYPNLFRHTCITRMCLYTDSIFQVRMLAGHKDLATTRRYHHVVLSYDHMKQNYSKTSQLLEEIKLPRCRANKYNL
jgi:site-specific recombinase XerD